MSNRFEAPDRRRVSQHEWDRYLRSRASGHQLPESQSTYTPPHHKPYYLTGPEKTNPNRLTAFDAAFAVGLVPATLFTMGISPALGLIEAGASLGWMAIRVNRSITGETLLPIPKILRHR